MIESFSSTPPSRITAQALAEMIADRMGAIASLEVVCVQVKPWGFEVFFVVNESTRDERYHLYDFQWQLMEEMPEVGFKFHIVDRLGDPLEQVISLESSEGIAVLPERENA